MIALGFPFAVTSTLPSRPTVARARPGLAENSREASHLVFTHPMSCNCSARQGKGGPGQLLQPDPVGKPPVPAGSAPTQRRGDVGKDRFHDVYVIANAQLIGDGEQECVRLGDGVVFLELFYENVRFGGVTPAEDRPG